MIDVTFDRVGKRYRVRQGAPASRLSWPPSIRRRASNDFWAIHDVSFDVPRGETLGIIGHNGAGKSTILKLLSRITAPSTGQITLSGAVSALIEVGSGFHPELTGRENVFLSGSILGMGRREIRDKFDRIVEFAGVAPFIDTPVKWYSSGMYVRLGFAIAAHLDADILLVDEVLAVGDAAFQRQCYERLGELRRAGTTMLFISHDLASVERLCDRALLMEKGRLAASGDPHDIIDRYLRTEAATVAEVADARVDTGGQPDARVQAITFHEPDGAEVLTASTGAPLVARVLYDVRRPIRDAEIEVFYYSRDGRTLHCQQSTTVNGGELTLDAGPGALEFVAPGLGLQPGIYSVGASIRERASAGAIDWFYGSTVLCVEPGKNVRGYFFTPHEWRLVTTHGQADGRHPHV
jgi:ABC-type polysaccharide/polyol phosphate transport system ATPase subunit